MLLKKLSLALGQATAKFVYVRLAKTRFVYVWLLSASSAVVTANHCMTHQHHIQTAPSVALFCCMQFQTDLTMFFEQQIQSNYYYLPILLLFKDLLGGSLNQ
jgi:hypothetical protein